MPKQYEAMRDRFLDQGYSEKEAKAKAAKIYNAKAKKRGSPSLAEFMAREVGKSKS